MSFVNDLPDYKLYSEENYIMHSPPERLFWNELEGLSTRIVGLSDTPSVKQVVNEWVGIIPCEPSNNWGYEYLVNDMRMMVRDIERNVDSGNLMF